MDNSYQDSLFEIVVTAYFFSLFFSVVTNVICYKKSYMHEKKSVSGHLILRCYIVLQGLNFHNKTR